MLQIEMSASARTVSGKGPMRQLRMKGQTPAVVYGFGTEALKLQFETKSLMATLLKFHRRNAIVTLNVDDKVTKNVIIGEVQTDPVKDSLVHVDFCEIDLDKEHTFNVPVLYQGNPRGVDLGGVLNVVHDTIALVGKPVDIPDEVSVDITDLDIGDSIKCGEIKFPDSVRLITELKALAVSVVRPGVKAEEEDVEEEGDEALAEEPSEETTE